MGELQNSSSMAVSTASGETSVSSSGGRPPKKKRNLPGMPDPEAEVIALSPKTLLATNPFVCEICKKGFQRDQNLQLHLRGHNLPWKLRQRTTGKEIRKRVYVCPEPGCVHHDPARALGDLTGIKKHFCRKHGEKKWKCDRCSKMYAVKSDWKAHMKTCGTREYKCDCGSIFSRRDSFFTHRAFCDALAEETARVGAATAPPPSQPLTPSTPSVVAPAAPSSIFQTAAALEGTTSLSLSSPLYLSNNISSILTGPVMSATALLQKAAQMGAASPYPSLFHGLGFSVSSSAPSVGKHLNVKSESNSTSTASMRHGLPLIGSSPPTTLDFLGVGMGDGGTSSRGLSALLTSFGGGYGVEAAATTPFGAGGSSNKETWEGAAERKTSC
ncbi:Protein indeterminate-domain 7 [Hibiscus syriacus]|uniref:Protein indeterminate-domain 7 n=1 Tax=Hibiscus syriacus TaxID=106335 RepID=A0A6A3CIR2_HIBSY|nr:zinc finger protein GAI-ASSOCIATED FACTOR 1-like [Hibiscus syriacus]KAE8729220.1 Protein indeterminate-domain 7 [Hibiscus syriacus]